MAGFTCPICRGALTENGGALRCPKGHSYDIARQGYVNLLLSNSAQSRRHGDDRLMVEARRAFLEQGYYRPILDGIAALLLPRLPDGCAVLDAGCGEGWYTAALAKQLGDAGLRFDLFGVDISKAAVKAAAARHAGLRLAIASAAHVPLADESCDAVLNVFSPLEAQEYRRLLKPGGILLRAVPRERHLWSLKAAVYDKPYENEPQDGALAGFAPAERLDVTAPLQLRSNAAIKALFLMTPYYYKTSRADQAKLDALTSLDTALEVRLLADRKL